jgi:hypothetical protein
MGEGSLRHENPPSAQDVIEGRLIQIGVRVLKLGNNVVIDYGLWGRDERSALRQQQTSARWWRCTTSNSPSRAAETT